MTSVNLSDIPALSGRYHQRYPKVDLLLTPSPPGSRVLAEAVAVATDILRLIVPAGHRLGSASPPSPPSAGKQRHKHRYPARGLHDRAPGPT